MPVDIEEKLRQLPLQQFVNPDEFYSLQDYYQFVYRQTQDPVFFVENVLTPVDQFGNRMVLTDYQEEAMYVMQNSQYSAMAWSRQIGKTETVSMIIPWLLFAQQQPWIVIAAPSHQQAKDLLTRQEQKIRDSKYLSDPNRVQILEGMVRVTIQVYNSANGQMVDKILRLEKISAGDKANKARGKSPSVLIIEESQFIADDVMESVVLPMASKKGSKIIQISTPYGKNHFYVTMFDRPYYETRIYDYTYGLDQGILDPNRIEDAKKNPQKFQQEYMCSFNVNTLSYIPSNILQDAIGDYILGTEEQMKDIDKKSKFFMGVDWGGSGEDRTVQVVIAVWFENDDLKYKVVDQIWFDQDSFSVKMDQISKMYHKYECAFQYIDSYIGESQEETLPKDYKMRIQTIQFSQQRKYNLYNNYKLQLEERNLTIPKDDLINGPFFISESEGLEEKKSASSPFPSIQPQGKNQHDDFPDALALAITCANEKFGSIIPQQKIDNIIGRIRQENRTKYKLKEGKLYYTPNYNKHDLLEEDQFGMSYTLNDSLDIDDYDRI